MEPLRFAFFLSLFWMPCATGTKLTPAKRDEQTLEQKVVWSGGYEGSYDNKHDMYWLIQAPEGQKIYLIFWYLPLKNEDCETDSKDYVQIEDGDQDEEKITQIYCRRKPTLIISESNELYIFFVTNLSGTSRRFHFHCDFFCEPLLPTLHDSYSCGRTGDRRKRNQQIEEMVKRGFNKKEADEVSWLVRRIFYGKESEHGDWPWLVSIHKYEPHVGEDTHKYEPHVGEDTHTHACNVKKEEARIKDKNHICGGNLIHPQWVLTAAHCFEDSEGDHTETNTNPNEYILFVGDHSIKETDAEFCGYPDEIFIHPDRDAETNNWDFALVKLRDPVPLSDHVGLVCLPTKDDKFRAEDELDCVAAGWGETDLGDSYNGVARHTDLSIVDNQDCAEFYEVEGAHAVASHIEDSKDVLCAVGEWDEDTCTGDSGGPLVCKMKDEDMYVLVGVTSEGIGCGTGLPGLYGRVTSVLPWIHETVIIEHLIGTCQR